ncbi:30S ribosomal protein S6 [Buchnera aphidicola (Hormaphis cornu)]|nr:30S ribosomal protein S6 [Buchnera aphidicola (Hormaphis cornu)]
MRHYEVVFMVHPDQSEQVPKIIELFSKIVCSNDGKIHRLEDWGRRQLAYSIKKIHKAHYVLMNIEIFPKFISNLDVSFRMNDAIIRHLIICVKNLVKEPSFILKSTLEKQDLK